MMISPVEKTATCCWNPFNAKRSLFACGTVAGALDASFDSSTELEIYEQSQGRMQKLAGITSAFRFCKLAWTSAGAMNGMLAGGLENGMLQVWNVDALLEGSGVASQTLSEASSASASALLFSKKAHEGLVKGVAWNPIQQTVLASGSSASDIAIWDLNAGKSVAPGPKSSVLSAVSDLAWNPQVQHIMATSSISGSIVIWDLKSKREVIQMTIPNRLSVSCIAWNPEVPTQILTACEDDSQPVVFGWDVRNAHAPEKGLSNAGHQRGILAMSWCEKDSEMLATAGKDNSVLIWNPKTAQKTAELPSSDNWVFDVKFCPKNPDLLSVASFDGKISFYSLQEQTSALEGSFKFSSNAAAASSFPLSDATSTSHAPQSTSSGIKVPRWLKRPVGACWSFSGELFCFGTGGKTSASTVFYRTVPEDADFYQTVLELEQTLDQPGNLLASYAASRASGLELLSCSQDIESYWFMLSIALDPSRKPLLLKVLGLAKDELRDRLRKLSVSTAEVAAANSQESLNSQSSEESVQAANACSSSDFASPPLSPTIPKPHSEIEFARFITQSIIVGDFDSAVQYCRHADKWADALILAHCGGSDLLEKTRKRFVERYTKEAPYLSLANLILCGDLQVIIQSSSLSKWQETMAIIVTFSTDSCIFQNGGNTTQESSPALGKDFSSLLSMLATRLAQETDNYFAAVCCFAAAGDLAGVIHWLPKASPAILTEDYVQFIMALNAARGDLLFAQTGVNNDVQSSSNTGIIDPKDRDYVLEQLSIYAKLLHREGLIRPAFKYAQLSSQVPEMMLSEEGGNDGEKEKLLGIKEFAFRARLYILCGSRMYLPPGYEVVQVQGDVDNGAVSVINSQFDQSQLGLQSGLQSQSQSQSQFQSQSQSQFITPPMPPVPQNINLSHQMQAPQNFTNQSQQFPIPTPPQVPLGFNTTGPRVATPSSAWNDAPLIDMSAFVAPPQSRPSPRTIQSPVVGGSASAAGVVVGPPKVVPVGAAMPAIQQPVPQMGIQQMPQTRPMVANSFTQPTTQIPQPMAQVPQPILQPSPQVPQPILQPSPQVPNSFTQRPLTQQPMPPQPQRPTPPIMQVPVPQPPPPVQAPKIQSPPSQAVPQQIPRPFIQQPSQQQQQQFTQPPTQVAPQPPSQQQHQFTQPSQQQHQFTQPSQPPAQQAIIDPKLQSSIITPLKGLLELCKSKSPPSQARLLEDCEKRLNALFAKLALGQSPSSQVLTQTVQLCTCITGRGWDEALAIQSSLYASHYDEVGNWMVGVKRLLELAKKV